MEHSPAAAGIARRKTQQRQLVYETVAATGSHPTAEWVYRQVRRQLPRISLGTVYRNLQRLVAEGKLKSWTRGRTTRFDADVSRHDHFVCRGCGLMLDLERTGEALAAERRLKARGHEIQDRILEFIGLCRDCRRGRTTNRSEGDAPWHR